jgi:hypothetical protein
MLHKPTSIRLNSSTRHLSLLLKLGFSRRIYFHTSHGFRIILKMPEYPTWWPKRRYILCCVLDRVLHDNRDYVQHTLDHSSIHLGVNHGSKEWHIMPSQEAQQEGEHARSSYPSLKILWLIQRDQSLKCDYYEKCNTKAETPC